MFGLLNNKCNNGCNNNNEYGWIWIVILFLIFTENNDCEKKECGDHCHDNCFDDCKEDCNENNSQIWIVLILLFIAFTSGSNSNNFLGF